MQPNAERSNTFEAQPDATVRMTVQEAASALGITVEAVRGRMHRGKYGREKAEDGRVFVLLSPDQLANGVERSESSTAHVHDHSSDRSHDQSPHVRERLYGQEELVEQLRDENAFLRAELEARNQEVRRREEEHREEAARKDAIIMSLTQRVPELEAPPEPQQPPETPSEAKDEVEPQSATEKQREPSPEPRSWWRRMFGG